MKKLKRVGLYGLSGVGKSSTIQQLVSDTDDVFHMDGTAFILQASNLSLDEFKRCPESLKHQYREQAIDLAFKHQNRINKHFLTAGHLAFPDVSGSINSVMTDKDKQFYTEFIYMDLPAELIYNRQQNDPNKKRNYSFDVITNWLTFEKNELTRVCEEENIPLYLLKETDMDLCIKFINKVIKS